MLSKLTHIHKFNAALLAMNLFIAFDFKIDVLVGYLALLNAPLWIFTFFFLQTLALDI